MIITETAAKKAIEILEVEGKAGWGLRIFVAGSSCCGPSYGLDLNEAPEATDEVFESYGLKVFIDKDQLVNFAGMTLDYIEEGAHEGFVLTGGMPSACASGSCASSSGCGSSCA